MKYAHKTGIARMSGGVDSATYRQQIETFDNPKFIEGGAAFYRA